MKAPRTKLLGRVQGLPVYLVDGEAIRNEREIEFTSGGHDLVYPHLVPFREVWIDDAIHGTIDRMATVFHEVIERDLMEDGWTYDRAHGVASRLETQFRREIAGRPPRSFDAKRVVAKIRSTCPHCA